MIRRRTFMTSIAALAVAGAASPVLADKPWFYATDGAVLQGYDVVAYFSQGKPVRGDAKYAVKWKGAMWYFASMTHRDQFEMNPVAYAPQYGGYCAFAVSRGYTAAGAPDAWQIVDGKLYLCYSIAVRERWKQDIPGHIRSGDANWPRVLDA